MREEILELIGNASANGFDCYEMSPEDFIGEVLEQTGLELDIEVVKQVWQEHEISN